MPTSSLGCLTVFVEGVTGKRRYATAAIESLTFRTRERQKKKKTTVEALAAIDINII